MRRPGNHRYVFDYEAKMMNGKRICLILGLFFLCAATISSALARQVVTEEDREWAKKVVEQEKTLKTKALPNSVAILYFNNKTPQAVLKPLEKGLAIMLMTDLSKIGGLQIVERARLEALVSELGLRQQGFIDSSESAQLGKFLGAENVVGGDILTGMIGDFKVDSSLLDVPREEIFGNPQTEGKLLAELFKMEKDLLFKIIRMLKIEPTPEQEAELRKPLTTNLQAFLAWVAAIDYSDQGDYAKADESAQQACAEDPGLCNITDEIRKEIVIAAGEGAKGRPEAYSETGDTSGSVTDITKNPDTVTDVTDRTPKDLDQDGITQFEGDCNDNDPSIHPGADDSNCDGVDNNCNGVADEDYVSLDTTCGVGACASIGVTSCINGEEVDSCTPLEPLSADDPTCDGIDDNCNGSADEDYVPVVTTCGTGACQASVETSCIDGLLSSPFCEPGPPSAEICDDGIDNDCDEQVDEGCSYAFPNSDPPLILDQETINTANSNMFDNPQLEASVNSGEYRPGAFSAYPEVGYLGWDYSWVPQEGWDPAVNYAPGLQTVGQDGGGEFIGNYLDPDLLAQINADPFLAYAVQVEEDVLNQQSLQMARQAAENAANNDLRDAINTALAAADIRTRDDFLLQQADAQSGRFLVDRNGGWVRTQQYVLRPSESSVQLLNVTYRGSGPQAGISTIDMQVNFTGTYSTQYSLQALPWSDWMHTLGPAEGGTRYVTSSGGLADMSVTFTNPGGRYLNESRTFAASVEGTQDISSETLTLVLGGQDDGTYSYTNDWTIFDTSLYWVYQDSDFIYTTRSNNPAPLYYMHRIGDYVEGTDANIEPLAVLDFYVVGDSSNAGNRGISASDYSGLSFRDVWDALRVNETGALSIGASNLEMAFTRGELFYTANRFGSETIDVVYTPMSRMLWKPKTYPQLQLIAFP